MPPVVPNRGSMSALGARAAVLGYDLAAVRPGIVHLGPGGFHRTAERSSCYLSPKPAAPVLRLLQSGSVPRSRRQEPV